MRLGLLATIGWIVGLTAPVFDLGLAGEGWDTAFSWRDLILIAGGLFLVWKATTEVHHAVDTSVECHITVTYRRDDALGLWVPARMEERYRRPGDSMQVTGVATYSRFRRFQVTTSEDVGAPADK